MVGSVWSVLDGRRNLHPNNIHLLDTNTHIPMSSMDEGELFEAQNVGEGSVISIGDGEISMSFPAIVMLHTASGDARNLKGSAYALPLQISKEHVRLRICYDAVGKHKSMYLRSFMCYPLRVCSKSRHSNTVLTNGVHNAVQWPEVLFKIENQFTANFLHTRRINHSLAYGIVFPNFLAIFMPENDIFIDRIPGLDVEIANRYCNEKDWDKIQSISCNEKYFLAMVLGAQQALHMLLPPVENTPRKRKHNEVVKIVYEETGDAITSSCTICFSYHASMKALYNPCYDVILNLLIVATNSSGWQNSEIQNDIAKLKRIQDLLSHKPTSAHNVEDINLLGQEV